MPQPSGPLVVPPGEEVYDSQFGIYCHTCSTTALAVYIVHTGMTELERQGVARRDLNDNAGWDCGTAGDYCPACRKPPVAVRPAAPVPPPTAEQPPKGPRCGNNPHARLTPGDRLTVAWFKAYLKARRDAR
ncbi:hypothetical protein ACFUJR_27840 [Streptomyces sp. NPDC057271]|uniref:hypothetical protein n=1 Tax=unclassified Streptomyces TaxID=2593676 RepID=UPI00362C5E13